MPKKILVVDDEQDNRTTAQTIFEKEGYTVFLAKNADEALEVANKESPDLILLDIMMPGTPVREIVPKLKAKIAYLSVVRISDAEKENLLKEGNIVDFIQKPFDIAELVKRVKKILK